MRILLAIEVEKILRRRLNQVILTVFTALLVVVYIPLWMATDVIVGTGADVGRVEDLQSSLFLEQTILFAMLMLYFFGFIAGVVVIGANVGTEYTWNTVRTLVSAEPRRRRVLLAKLVALWGTITAGLLFGLIVALVTSTIITAVDGQLDLSFFDGEYLRESLYAFARLLAATAPYFALAALLGTVGRSATAGIALALGVAFLEGIVGGLMVLASGWLEEIPRYMLDQNADTLAVATGGPFNAVIGEGTPLGDAFGRPTVAHATTVLLIWASAFLAAACWAVARQDLEYQGG